MSASSAQPHAVAAPAVAIIGLAAVRRALIRLQAARTKRRLIDELIAQPLPRYGREPAFARLDRLTARYAALGGDPSAVA